MISRANIIQALEELGIPRGAVVFSHANLGFFGPIEGVNCARDLSLIFLECLLEKVGPTGTLVFPAFTYTFGRESPNKVFDPKKSLTKTSGIANILIEDGRGHRSVDPMISVVAIGRQAKELTADVDLYCFGPDSIWSRLLATNASICNFNLNSGSTYLHFVERLSGVEHRKDFAVGGRIVTTAGEVAAEYIYYGRDLDRPEHEADFSLYHSECVNRGVTRQVQLGRGSILRQSCQDATNYLQQALRESPLFLTKAAGRFS